MSVKLLTEHHLEFLSLKRRLQRLVRVYTCQNAKLLEISCTGSISNIHADTEQQSHVEMIDTDIGIVYLSRDM